MIILVTILLVIVCAILIGAILVQPGEGGDFMTPFAGGSTQTALGARSAATFWSKTVMVAASLFMLLALALTILETREANRSLLDEAPAAAPEATGTAPAPEPKAETPAPSETPAPASDTAPAEPAPAPAQP